ncbi:MAG: nucleotidyl transferase AbiEii/AbiGii toxin family protein [Bacteroidota bacterium]
MLHKNPELIEQATFELIQQLQNFSELKEFYLVGGTALTLQFGHRNSLDIDLFSTKDFLDSTIINFLRTKFTIDLVYNKPNSIICIINGVKVDFIKHDYPIIEQIITEEGIRMLSPQDICAMKLNAIQNSGQRLKDFIDIYFLLEHFSIKQMLEFYSKKYPIMNPVIALRAITYFDDIDPNIDPPKLVTPLPLEKIKKRIVHAVQHSNKTF